MKDPFAVVAEQLKSGGFREIEPACFTSKRSARVVALIVCSSDPPEWRDKADHMLRREAMRLAPSWARYVIIIVDGAKTAPLAWAAAAFAQDVSKCRRIVLFFDPATDRDTAIPFLGLPPEEYGTDAPASDVEALVRRELPTGLADAFLDEDLPTARVQTLAEELDS
jgi:hypothetical protein